MIPCLGLGGYLETLEGNWNSSSHRALRLLGHNGSGIA